METGLLIVNRKHKEKLEKLVFFTAIYGSNLGQGENYIMYPMDELRTDYMEYVMGWKRRYIGICAASKSSGESRSVLYSRLDKNIRKMFDGCISIDIVRKAPVTSLATTLECDLGIVDNQLLKCKITKLSHSVALNDSVLIEYDVDGDFKEDKRIASLRNKLSIINSGKVFMFGDDLGYIGNIGINNRDMKYLVVNNTLEGDFKYPESRVVHGLKVRNSNKVLLERLTDSRVEFNNSNIKIRTVERSEIKARNSKIYIGNIGFSSSEFHCYDSELKIGKLECELHGTLTNCNITIGGIKNNVWFSYDRYFEGLGDLSVRTCMFKTIISYCTIRFDNTCDEDAVYQEVFWLVRSIHDIKGTTIIVSKRVYDKLSENKTVLGGLELRYEN